MEKVLLIDKPSGITSYDVIRILKRRYLRPLPKIGHAGTLDPLATGLMMVAVGSATKKLSNYLKLNKTYRAEVLVGVATDTGDITGKTTEEVSEAHVAENAVRETLRGMEGAILLAVPAYSAVKREGKPLYLRARKGEKFEPPKKEMRVLRAELLEIRSEGTRDVLAVEFEVASGTYIRSLAEELGKRLGFPATLQALRRTRIGDFKVEDAEKI